MKQFHFQIGARSRPYLAAGLPGVSRSRAVGLILSVTCSGGAAQAATDSTLPRFAAPPTVATVSLPGGAAGSGRTTEWSAAVDCAPPVNPVSLIGARVVLTFDFNLDGIPDAADSLGVSPADCGEVDAGRVSLRRRFTLAHPAVLRATLRTAAGVTTATHAQLTAGTGSLLSITRYCARPKNGEPEWIEVRNNTAFTIPLAAVRLEARTLSGILESGAGFVAGSDTAELRLWQPGARLVALSSWSNLRNSADTVRLTLSGADGTLILDSLFYGAGSFPHEECASLQSEESGAGAHGYALEVSSVRWNPHNGPLAITVRAPAEGRYDLRVYDLDGVQRCVLARHAEGGTSSSSFSLPHLACPGLAGSGARRGTYILHLQPRSAPGIRKAFRVTE